MFTDPSDAAPPLCHVSDGHGDSLCDRLWAQVRAVFPALPAANVSLEQGGGDHLLLIVDGRRAFRFPRIGTHGLALEISALRHLRTMTRIAVPDYDMIDPGGTFAGYRLIPGVPLTPSRFRAMTAAARRAALADAVDVMASLHALDAAAVTSLPAWPRLWTADRFAARIEACRLPLLSSRFPALAAPIERFVRQYRADRSPGDVVVHGDLVSDHLLIGEATDRLEGIIDFGDVALGDPANDLLGFLAFGPDAAAEAARLYGLRRPTGDAGLLARATRHFVRHRIDRLFEAAADGAPSSALQSQAVELETLLAELGHGGSAHARRGLR